jgi:hypothetical protein
MPLGFAIVGMEVLSALFLLANIMSVARAWPHLVALGLALCAAFIIFVELLMLSLPNE